MNNNFEFLSLKKAEGDKKYQVKLKNKKTGREKTIKFGAKSYTDYTISKDKEQKERYLARHKKNENWNNPATAGALSRWILWNKPTIKESLADYKKKFNL